MDKLEALHGDKTGEQVLTDLCKCMDANGSLATLRHGVKCYGRTLGVAWFKAAHVPPKSTSVRSTRQNLRGHFKTGHRGYEAER